MNLAKGFIFNGISCGIKNNNELDLGMLYSSTPCTYAGVFTQNSITAAPVKLCKKLINNKINGVIVNSGNANALTGKQGMKDALEMTKSAELALNLEENSFLALSTGVIGRTLPMNNISKGIMKITNIIKEKQNNPDNFAQSILTTDTGTKIESKLIQIEGKQIKLLGIAKGAGMIHPNMATMLAFITSDINISKNLLQKALNNTVKDTFNSISVDGDQSTNDSVIFLANGNANNKIIKEENKNYFLFEKTLKEICLSLAQKIIQDGEGASKFIQIDIKGAKSKENAKQYAQAIACSPLVKTAFFGEDPNWGRFIASIGASEIEIDESKIELTLGESIKLFYNGEPANYNEKEAKNYMKNKNIYLSINLNLGIHNETIYTCDLSDEYVKINSGYTS